MTTIHDRATTHAPERLGSHAKDAAICAAILGGASIAWFGWGQAGQRFVGLLVAGMVLGALALVAAIVATVRTPGPPTMAVDPQVRRTYNLALVAEVAAILAAALLLARAGRSDLLPAVVLVVVGVHFLPLAKAFVLPVVRYAAWASMLVGLVALWAGLAGWLPAATVAGLGGGAVLLVTSVASTLLARRS